MTELEVKPVSNFLRVASCQSIARAARAAGISQPAMTRQMQNLEQCLGTTLLKRRASGVELTAMGKQFRDQASRFLTDLDDILCHVRAEARADAGTVIMGCDSDLSVPALCRARERAVLRNAGLHCELVELTREESMDALLDRRVDLLATSREPAPDVRNELKAEFCVNSTPFIVLPSDHPLAADSGPVSIAELSGQPLVILNASAQPGLIADLRDAFHGNGVRLHVAQVASAEFTLLNYVLSGIGVGLLVGFTTALDDTQLVARPLANFVVRTPKRTVLLWRRGEDTELLTAIRAGILKELREDSPRNPSSVEPPLAAT